MTLSQLCMDVVLSSTACCDREKICEEIFKEKSKIVQQKEQDTFLERHPWNFNAMMSCNDIKFTIKTDILLAWWKFIPAEVEIKFRDTWALTREIRYTFYACSIGSIAGGTVLWFTETAVFFYSWKSSEWKKDHIITVVFVDMAGKRNLYPLDFCVT